MRRLRGLALLLVVAPALAGCTTYGEAVGPPGYRPLPPSPGYSFFGPGGGSIFGSSGGRSNAASGGNGYGRSGMPFGVSPAAGAVLFGGI